MRRTRFGRVLSLFAALLAVVMVATACGGDDGAQGEGGGEGGGDRNLTIGYIAWDENIALAHLFKAQLEERGYTVELRQLDVAPTWQALAQGEIDLFQDAWLPTTHATYWEQYQDQVEDLGVWYDQATLNIAVPSYVKNVNSIEDLKNNAGMFNGTITGIEPGAGLTRITQDEVIPQYGLQGTLNLQTSSTTAMLSELHSAIQRQEPIVVTLWHPHWAYSRYDLKDLQDPKGALGKAEELHMLGREGFSQDFPQLAGALKSFKMTDEQLGSLEDKIQEAGSGQELQAATEWANENKNVVDGMFGNV
ncbi:glycine betaine ABC transporter substrate-binding protein [Prauserella oleivorans]|uniref:Glycine betaine ABC transporter substrate-binding protein n=1 Tax=Prauserella oleivorans TaxID=1478153 RepID=A0ABW5W8I6_9PSEU